MDEGIVLDGHASRKQIWRGAANQRLWLAALFNFKPDFSESRAYFLRHCKVLGARMDWAAGKS
jgi:hypothetical protein